MDLVLVSAYFHTPPHSKKAIKFATDVTDWLTTIFSDLPSRTTPILGFELNDAWYKGTIGTFFLPVDRNTMQLLFLFFSNVSASKLLLPLGGIHLLTFVSIFLHRLYLQRRLRNANLFTEFMSTTIQDLAFNLLSHASDQTVALQNATTTLLLFQWIFFILSSGSNQVSYAGILLS